MYVIALEGIRDADPSNLDDQIKKTARMAINKAAERGRGWFAKDMKRQIAFPSNYLTSKDRLYVSRKASDTSLEAVIAARRRPTSLARFVTGSKSGANRGIHVQVKPGKTRLMKNAFLLNLRSGNQGLAVRTKAGQKPQKAYRPTEIFPGVWLLYGPSVDQAFSEMLKKQDRPYEQIEEFLSAEFERLLKVEW